MITTSIRDILTGKFRESVTHIPEDAKAPYPYGKEKVVTPEFKEHQFYLFFDDDNNVPLYVGQSKHPLWVAEHCACHGDKTIGKLIEVNAPKSHSWYMRLYTKEEVVNRINHTRKQKGLQCYPSSRFTDEEVKVCLIQNHNPRLNLAYRQSKMRLPSTYTLPQSEIPDRIIHKSLHGMDEDLMPIWDVSYRAFDYKTMENCQYKAKVYAPNYNACYSVISDFLGYKPDDLRISAKERKVIEA